MKIPMFAGTYPTGLIQAIQRAASVHAEAMRPDNAVRNVRLGAVCAGNLLFQRNLGMMLPFSSKGYARKK